MDGNNMLSLEQKIVHMSDFTIPLFINFISSLVIIVRLVQVKTAVRYTNSRRWSGRACSKQQG